MFNNNNVLVSACISSASKNATSSLGNNITYFRKKINMVLYFQMI